MKNICIYLLLIILFGSACKSKDTNTSEAKSPSETPAAIGTITPLVDSLSYYSIASHDGVNIAFRDINPDSRLAEPILFIHGFINQGVSWNDTAIKEELEASGFRLIIPDLRGNGRSDKPQSGKAYADNSEVKDLEVLMKSLAIDRYKAIGYSRGSIVLAELLARNQNITQAVIGGMGLDFSDPNWSRRIMFQKGFEGNTEEYPETQGAVNYAKSINADLPSLALQQKHQPSTSEERLALIRSQVLVIAGDLDQENGDPEDLSDVIHDAQLVIVPGDHNTTYRKKSFAKAVLEFLDVK